MRIHPRRIRPMLSGLAILILTVLVLLLLATFERTIFVRMFKVIWLVGGVASASMSFYQALCNDGEPLFEARKKAEPDKGRQDPTDARACPDRQGHRE